MTGWNGGDFDGHQNFAAMRHPDPTGAVTAARAPHSTP